MERLLQPHSILQPHNIHGLLTATLVNKIIAHAWMHPARPTRETEEQHEAKS